MADQVPMPGQLSPDRQFLWNGQQWISTISPDGKKRWDGVAWIPIRRRLAWKLLISGLGALLLTVAATAYTVYYSATCTIDGCQDIWFLEDFYALPLGVVGAALVVASIVVWRVGKRKRRGSNREGDQFELGSYRD